MLRNKVVVSLLILTLISISILIIPAQAAQNASVPANNTTPGNISTTNLTVTQGQFASQERVTAEKAAEIVILISVILSPISFLLSVVALWIALKNRRKTYTVK